MDEELDADEKEALIAETLDNISDLKTKLTRLQREGGSREAIDEVDDKLLEKEKLYRQLNGPSKSASKTKKKKETNQQPCDDAEEALKDEVKALQVLSHCDAVKSALG